MRALLMLAVAAALLVPGAAALSPADALADAETKDIYIDLMSCPGWGSYKEVASAGGVTMWVYTCDPPPPYPPEVAA